MSFGCQYEKSFKISTPVQGSLAHTTAVSLSEFLKEHGWDIEVIPSTEFGSTQILRDGIADFAIIQNLQDSSDDYSVRTVLPLYPMMAMVFVRDTIDADNFNELLKGRKVGAVATTFFHKLFKEYQMDEYPAYFDILHAEDIQGYMDIVFKGDYEVLCAFGSVYSPVIIKMLNQEGWKLFSIGDVENKGKGSAVEGFCLNNPIFYPFIIPRQTFGQAPETPVLTIASNVMMATTIDADDELVFDLVRDIIHNQQYLARENYVFSHVTANFKKNTLVYPLHAGTRNFLDRNAPSFLERYAEMFGVIFSIFIVAVGSFRTIRASLRQRKKDRIDVYYNDVNEIRKAANKSSSTKEFKELIEKIEQLKDKAFSQLIDEKLTADESFSIFLTQANQELSQLQKRINEFEN